MLDDPKGKFRINPIFRGLGLDIGLHLLGCRFVAMQLYGINRNAGQARELRPVALVNGHLHRRRITLRGLGGNDLGSGFCSVCGKRKKRQGVEYEPKKLLDHGGLHGKGLYLKANIKRNKNLACFLKNLSGLVLSHRDQPQSRGGRPLRQNPIAESN